MTVLAGRCSLCLGEVRYPEGFKDKAQCQNPLCGAVPKDSLVPVIPCVKPTVPFQWQGLGLERAGQEFKT